MPLLDEQGNAIGCVQVEQPEDGNYSRNFMIIDFSAHKLRLYPEEAEFASDLRPFNIQNEINCQYITKVGSVCVDLHLRNFGVKYFFPTNFDLIWANFGEHTKFTEYPLPSHIILTEWTQQMPTGIVQNSTRTDFLKLNFNDSVCTQMF